MQTSYFARLDHINSQRGFGNMTDRKFKRRPDLKRCRVHGAVWRFLLVLGVCTACFVPGAGAESTYALDQKFGSIDFSVDNVGLFTSEGQFKRFQASLTIDEAHPERTRINVDVDAGSVDMPWEDGVKMLRSADYFDVQNFPRVQFKSLTVQALTPDHYVIHGALEIRRITQPCVLDARMVGRHMDKATNREIVDFIVTGSLRRSDYGMVADQGFISNTVKLKITAHIQLAPAGNAN